jgi:hypothetical protein
MAKGNGAQDPRVSSLDEARRRKAEQEQAAKRAAKAVSGGTLGQRLFGIIMIAMAIGFIAYLFGAFDGGRAPGSLSSTEVKP